MPKNKLTAAIISVVLLAGVAGVTIFGSDNKSNDGANQATTTEQTPATQEKITFSEDGKTVAYEGVEDETALATLESLTEVDSTDSSYGKFVTGINGVKADPKTEFWSFYINGKMSDEGASTYKAKAGDKFEWRLEKIEQ